MVRRLKRLPPDWHQRRELHHIYHWIRQPTDSRISFLTRMAVKAYLNGVDAKQHLKDEFYATEYLATTATYRARAILNEERFARKSRIPEILAERYVRDTSSFTFENIRVNIDPEQDRNYGMVTTSIYCVVEVWLDDENVDKEYLVNFSDYDVKEWLTKLLVWALLNTRQVLLRPATPANMAEMKMFVPKDKK